MHLSVICGEDMATIESRGLGDVAGDVEGADEGTDSRTGVQGFFASIGKAFYGDVCRVWDEVTGGQGKHMTASAPQSPDSKTTSPKILMLSGELDPVTPPRWAEGVKERMAHAAHVVFPGTGHGTLRTICGARVARAFLNAPDTSLVAPAGRCLSRLRRPAFFLSPAGPYP